MRTRILALLLFALPIFAQIDNGNITGRVTDPSGAVIAGAQITVTQTDMNFETIAVTNEEGIYRALNLRPGPYRLTVVAQGFKKLLREGIDLRVGQTLAVNHTLEIGVVADSVEVVAKAQLLDTETSATGAALRGDYFYNLPNYQKHTQAVLFFTPGISFSSNAFTGSVSGMSVNGLSGTNLGVFEDGAIGTMGARGSGFINESVANSIEDMKVLTSALPAEYGHATGGVISVVKKSGTNQLHGIVSDQIRTRRMQHRRFFEQYRNSQVQPGWEKAPGLIVNNPDANISGPVYIPKIYDGRNKTFFMFGWQMMIEKQTKQASNWVATPDMLNGDFTFAGSGVTPNTIYDPTTTRQEGGKWYRDAFPGNKIPQNRWSKVAKTVLAMNPVRQPNAAGYFNGSGPQQNIWLGPMKVVKWDNYTTRIDQQFGPSVKAFGTWTYNKRWERNPPYTVANSFFDATLNKAVNPRSHTAAVGTTWIVTPTMVNDLRATYYGTWNTTDSIARDADYATAIGMGGMGLPATCMPGGITTGLSGENLNVGCGSKTVHETLTLKDDLSKAWGTHSFKTGFEVLRYRLNGVSVGTPDGNFTYAGTTGLLTSGQTMSNTGINLANFMVGAISSVNFSQRLHNDQTRSWQYSFYFQDDWKVSPNLTLNMGLRWNVEPPKKQKEGYISLFDLTLPDNAVYSNTADLVCPAGGCLGAYKHPKGANPFRTDYGRFDPSFGLSWHPLSRLVFRGGFRMSHIDIRTDNTSLIFSDEMLDNAVSMGQTAGNFQPLFMLDNGIPAWSYPALRADGSVPYVATNPGSRGVRIVSDDLKTPYVMTWNAGIQYELSKDYLLEMRYDGSAQAKGFGDYDINSRPWGLIPTTDRTGFVNLEDPANSALRQSWAAGGKTQYARPYPNIGNIAIVGNVYHLGHHAGLVRVEKRFSKGLNFQAFYQYQKTLAGGSGSSAFASGNPYLDWGLFKARTSMDQTHNFTGTMNYEIPIGKGRKFMNRGGVLNALFGEYMMMFTYTIASGNPAGMSITNGPTTTNYPGWMGTYGGVLLTQLPKLRENWQDIGTNRFKADTQNSMIDCGAFQAGWGNGCFTYLRSFMRGTNGSNLWDNQRIIAANMAVSKEVPIKERLRLQVRLDIQNPFKWYNWGGPNTALNMSSATAAKTFGTNTGSGESGTGTAGYGGTPLMNLSLAFKW